ncbi:hypothetical protein F4777DRAFT_499003 [Nemania sp. FL0916]|nr:hypothetical protein F4777DRAFT_499003 [Nemania sp. FL0916]
MCILTVTNTMPTLTAVKAHDDYSLFFVLFLWAIFGDMPKPTAISAFSEASVDGLTSIGQASQVLLSTGRPDLPLTSADGLRFESIIDLVLLVKVALEVHVCESRNHGRVLQGNQINTDFLVTESSLQFDISHFRGDVDILLNSFLDVIHVFIAGCLYEFVPRNISLHLFKMRAVNFSWILAISYHMAYFRPDLCQQSSIKRPDTILLTFLLTVFTNLSRLLWAILCHVTFFMAVATFSSKLTRRRSRTVSNHMTFLIAVAAFDDPRVGTVGLIVTGKSDEHNIIQSDSHETYPSSPQL